MPQNGYKNDIWIFEVKGFQVQQRKLEKFIFEPIRIFLQALAS